MALITKIIQDPAIYMRPTKEYTNEEISYAPFKNWYIKNIKPKVFVELGTGIGSTFFSLCEVIKTFGLNTTCFAVDTWMNYSNLDDEIKIDPFEFFINEYIKYDAFANFSRKTIIDSLSDFDDKTIDLLQISGNENYQLTKKYFESFLPKLSNTGIVFFHNIFNYKFGKGINHLWKDIKTKYQTLEFYHANGLGIVFVGQELNKEISELIYCDKSELNLIRNIFEALGNSLLNDFQKNSKIQKLRYEISYLNNLNTEMTKENQNLILEIQKNDLQIKELELNLQKILLSKSWKITSPLRKIKKHTKF